MTSFHDRVQWSKHIYAPTDFGRGFKDSDVQSLDAPDRVPAGSTISYSSTVEYFHATRCTYRGE